MATRYSSQSERSRSQLNGPERFRNRGEADHWSRSQAAHSSSFSWARKAKARPGMLSKLTAEMADHDLIEFRKRNEGKQP
jgi:hypothetical protein